MESPLQAVCPEEVLYEFDGPRIFTTRSAFGLILAYVVRQEDGRQLAVLAPTSRDVIQSLLKGRATVREALETSWAWLASIGYDWNVQNVVSLKLPIAEDFLPRPGTMLYRHLQPVLSVKLEGKNLGASSVKASVIRQAIDAATVSIKRVLDHLWENKPEGRPTNALRLLSDLPAQRFAFGSFEVMFGRPVDEPALHEPYGLEIDLEQVGDELERLMDWAQGSDSLSGGSEPDLALLKALERLVPPSSGPVESVSISGAMFRSGKSHLVTREATKRVRRALKKHESDQVLISLTGRIGELDKDKLQFTLRDIQKSSSFLSKDECICRFSNELLESVFEHFSEDAQVAVSGRLIRGDVEISDIAALGRA